MLLPLAAHAQTRTTFGDIIIAPEILAQQAGNHGYVEYPITVYNRSPKDAHRVTLSLPRSRYTHYGYYLRSITRHVEVGPSASVRVSLWQPDIPFAGSNDLEVTIDGKPQEQAVSLASRSERGGRLAMYGYYRSPGSSSGAVLVSRGVPGGVEYLVRWQNSPDTQTEGFPPEQAAPPAGVARPGTSPLGTGRVVAGMGMAPSGVPVSALQMARAEVPVSGWPTSWLSYSSYDGVVVTREELSSMPAEVQSALWHYTEAGGCLLVLGGGKVPDSWQPVGPKARGLTRYAAGFGECLVHDEADIRRWSRGQWQQVVEAWTNTATPWGHVLTIGDANRAFPVVDNLAVPVRGLFLLMVLFALAIGPANLYLLARWKRRIWLLWTVPAVSLATCVAVFGYMVIAEGWHGHRRAEGITYLDERTHRATTLGYAAFYSPLAPRDGLRFGYATELAPQVRQETYNRSGTPLSIDWTGEQHLDSGWVQPRVPLHFRLRKSEVRRERITAGRGQDGSATFVNGLGADISRIWVADRQGKVYSATDVAAGAQATLQPESRSLRTDPQRPGMLRNAYRGADWLKGGDDMVKAPEGSLEPGRYLAVVQGAPFIEEGLPGAQVRPGRSIVYGVMTEPLE